ncbi:MAG: energy transducer TonB [Bacteroidia bacterium]
MLRGFLFILAFLFSISVLSQGKIISVSAEANVVGGREALEQVLQTQLTLPKLLLTKDFSKEVIVYFELDSLDHAKSVTFNTGLNNLLGLEIKRILKFLKFQRKTSISETPYEYYLTLNLSTEKYNKYMKQKSKPFVKTDKIADSSFVVYTKADKSPLYYKGGDEGLVDYIMNEIQYPDIAKEKSIQGTVVLEFIVELNGFITNINVKQGVSGGCTEEALRIIQQTKWQPAVLNNKYVRYRMNYPITFNLQNSFKDNTTPRQGSGY